MHRTKRGRPTIGLLAGWHLYWTATPPTYLGPLFKGISRAALDLDCNLLLGCGMGTAASPNDSPRRPAWPTLSSDVDFVPIGPWNTDGIIIANPLQSEVRSQYIQELMATGHSVLFIGPGERGPSIVIDNEDGILQAIRHLVNHGHRHIAFIAGSPEDMDGDTGDRLRAYQTALAMYNLDNNHNLVAFGRHSHHGGYSAMRLIMDSGATFTAVLASNDESAIGAMQILKEAGRRIPQDVAIIGFDDRIECVGQEPALSSVRVPLFGLGYQALELILKQIEGALQGQIEYDNPMKVPIRLITRASCGCGPHESLSSMSTFADSLSLNQATRQTQVAQAMAAAIFDQAQGLTNHECQLLCTKLVESFVASAMDNTTTLFEMTLENVLRQTAEVEDDAHIWQEAISILSSHVPILLPAHSPSFSQESLDLMIAMINQARLSISAKMQLQHQQHIVKQHWASNRLSGMTAKLLTVLDETQIFDILAQHLPDIGVHFALVSLFEAEGDDPVSWSTLRIVTAPDQPMIRFHSREFPPDELFTGENRFNLALLPLVNQHGQLGFVVFDTTYLDLYGAIVQQLGGALNTAQLYRQATEGRRLAEEANQIKSRFLSTVGHELRTPLNLIVGLSGMLYQESRKEGLALPPPFQKDVERIHAQAQHLGGLIGDVLDLASSDAQQLRLTQEYIDLGRALGIVAETGRHLAAEKGLAWHATLPNSGPWVWGDRTRLRQVALNLISNAVKFTTQGSIEMQIETNADSVTITVHDTGLGIPRTEQRAIFDEFHQSERSISRGFGGLGLGLTICKRLVEMHNGTLGVKSSGEEGSGSTFYFTLPLVQRPTMKDQPTTSAGNAQTILLLTTSASTSERLREHLTQRGFDVQVVLIDEMVIWQSLLASSPPDAVVLDVSVTSESIWLVLRATMDNLAMQSIPVLFYTISEDNGSVLELDYLTKPIRLAELKRAINQHWEPDEATASTRTILVVDDDPNTLDMHARIVHSQSETNQVLTARNGREALDILMNVPVNLLLLDLMMPEIDGFQILEAMREHEHTRNIPVIVLTGRLLTEADMARLNRGVVTVLSKGLFSVDETLTHVSEALNRKRKLSSDAQRLVRQAMAFLHENYSKPITRRDIAQHVGLAEDHLTHCFRQELGMTPIAYLNRYRVNQAKQPLKDGKQSITEIALDVGFSDSGYFSRVFRRETGLTPEAYRRT